MLLEAQPEHGEEEPNTQERRGEEIGAGAQNELHSPTSLHGAGDALRRPSWPPCKDVARSNPSEETRLAGIRLLHSKDSWPHNTAAFV